MNSDDPTLGLTDAQQEIRDLIDENNRLRVDLSDAEGQLNDVQDLLQMAEAEVQWLTSRLDEIRQIVERC